MRPGVFSNLLAIFLFVFCLPSSLASVGKSVSVRPPTRFDTNERGGGGGFTGYRQLSKVETQKVSATWRKMYDSSMIISGASSIEAHEMIVRVERCAEAMPGRMPQRREIMVFGEFEEDDVKCLSVGYTDKLKCPWDMTILAILCKPKEKDVEGRADRMANFIIDLSKENAIWPDFATELGKLDTFAAKPWVQNCQRLVREFKGQTIPFPFSTEMSHEERELLQRLYREANRSPIVVLDNFETSSPLPPYWFVLELPTTKQAVFFRQKRLVEEFEIRFDPPVTGTSGGSATVGCHIIVDATNEQHRSRYLTASQSRDIELISSSLIRHLKTPEKL